MGKQKRLTGTNTKTDEGMFSTARVIAFGVSFVLALPVMLALLRGEDGVTSHTWMVGAMFAAAVAVVVALQFGKERK